MMAGTFCFQTISMALSLDLFALHSAIFSLTHSRFLVYLTNCFRWISSFYYKKIVKTLKRSKKKKTYSDSWLVFWDWMAVKLQKQQFNDIQLNYLSLALSYLLTLQDLISLRQFTDKLMATRSFLIILHAFEWRRRRNGKMSVLWI